MKFYQKAKKFLTILAAVAILMVVPGLCSIEASADGPVTYAVKYVPGSRDWRYQANASAFDDNAPHRELYYLLQELKDGDLVVVYNDSPSVPDLNLGTRRLSNLTVTGTSSFVVIYCGDIDNCYLLNGAACSVNANVTNAYVYDTVLCNFNKNVGELYVYPQDAMTATIGCSGTVDHLYAASRTTGKTYYNFYSFQAGSLGIKDGILTTASGRYSTAPNPASVTVTRENFDYVRYANDYPDVKAALGLNAAALYGHYTTYGIKEGRIAYAVANPGAGAGTGTATGEATSASEFNYIRYADKNPDLKAAFGYDAKALYKHYTTFGSSENRGSYSIYDTFDYTRYADDHADLKAAFGYDAKALFRHYATYGISEGRGNYFK